jgi:hypothetical protein
MHYAQLVGAGLILIDEGAESDLRRSLWNGSIVNNSSVPVLSVHHLMNDGEKDEYRA